MTKTFAKNCVTTKNENVWEKIWSKHWKKNCGKKKVGRVWRKVVSKNWKINYANKKLEEFGRKLEQTLEEKMRREKVARVWEKVGGQKVLGERWRSKSGNIKCSGRSRARKTKNATRSLATQVSK